MKKIISLLITVCFLSISVCASDSMLFEKNIAQFKSFQTNGSSVSVACSDGAVYTTGGIGAVKMLGFKPDGTAVTEFETINGVSSAFKVVSGKNHTLAVTTAGKLYAWGDNSFGQLGTGTTENADQPVQISSITGNVIDIAAGDNYSFALTYDGSLYAWGNNSFGQLGDGTTENKLVPTKITAPSKIALVAAGNGHTIMISTIGKAYVCGKNDFGQLGTGNTENVSVLTPVSAFDGSVMFALGDGFSTALSSGGNITVCGRNDLGQLGTGNTENVLLPVTLRSVSGIYYIAAGDSHVLAASAAGGIYTWGDNSYGQLGRDGDSSIPAKTSLSSSVTAMDAGRYSSAVVTIAGTLNLCGNIGFGEYKIIGGADGPTSIIVTTKPDPTTDIALLVDGNRIITDVPPMIKDDRTLVPVRGVFEALEVNVDWNADTRTVTSVSKDGSTTVVLTIGKTTALVNGEEKEIDVPAQIINDRTMVPVRFIAQSLGCDVDWDNELRMVIINSK